MDALRYAGSIYRTEAEALSACAYNWFIPDSPWYSVEFIAECVRASASVEAYVDAAYAAMMRDGWTFPGEPSEDAIKEAILDALTHIIEEAASE